jgi:hypothetical protein
MKGGKPMQRLLAEIQGFIAASKSDPALAEFIAPLEKSVERMQGAVMWLMQNAMKNFDEAGGASTDFLRLAALTVMSFMWARIAKAALAGIAKGEEKEFYEAKLATGRFFIKRMLPHSDALLTQIQAGVEPMMALRAEQF